MPNSVTLLEPTYNGFDYINDKNGGEPEYHDHTSQDVFLSHIISFLEISSEYLLNVMQAMRESL